MNSAVLLRRSLMAVWLGTALVSVLELDGQSATLLHAAGLHDPTLVRALVLSGAGADALVGLALWRWPGRRSYGAALGLMGVMTLVATVLLPALWLHPLGPLLKNLPLAAVLWHLMTTQERA